MRELFGVETNLLINCTIIFTVVCLLIALIAEASYCYKVSNIFLYLTKCGLAFWTGCAMVAPMD